VPDPPTVISSPIPDQGTVTKTLSGATVTPKDQDQGQGAGDMAISAAIRKAIMSDASLSVKAQNVLVDAANGTVILRGTVASTAERSRIVALARDSSGPATRVDDQLAVGTPP
jgi:osmotically-inducible protein OsmY